MVQGSVEDIQGYPPLRRFRSPLTQRLGETHGVSELNLTRLVFASHRKFGFAPNRSPS